MKYVITDGKDLKQFNNVFRDIYENEIESVKNGKEDSITTNSNYIKFSGGVIIQWGISGVIADGGSEDITFPIPFPNNVYAVVVSSTIRATHGVSTGSGGTSSVSLTGFTMCVETGATNQGYWIAIGN